MKNKPYILLLAIFMTFCLPPISAQYCEPTTAIPYNSNMPGITQVVLNTIDRISQDCENYPLNSYVNTGFSTTLQKGQTYTISITTTVDASISPDMNIRVWIDYNQDFDLADVGETVISADHQPPGTYTGSFTVPATAMGGPTRMRVTSKMTDLGGHTLPSPCDDPADPFGYHGEFEDYTVEIVGTTGIDVVSKTLNSMIVRFVDGSMELNYKLEKPSAVSLEIYNLLGAKMYSSENSVQSQGEQIIKIDSRYQLFTEHKALIVVFCIDGQKKSKKIVSNN